MSKSVFRSVTLMLMITMVHSESKTDSIKLIELKSAANATKFKVSSQLDRLVLKVPHGDPCEDKFFCLVEQVLHNVSLPELSDLHRKLKVYNKAGNFSCRLLNVGPKYKLSIMIGALHNCAASRLASGPVY